MQRKVSCLILAPTLMNMHIFSKFPSNRARRWGDVLSPVKLIVLENQYLKTKQKSEGKGMMMMMIELLLLLLTNELTLLSAFTLRESRSTHITVGKVGMILEVNLQQSTDLQQEQQQQSATSSRGWSLNWIRESTEQRKSNDERERARWRRRLLHESNSYRMMLMLHQRKCGMQFDRHIMESLPLPSSTWDRIHYFSSDCCWWKSHHHDRYDL